ncbi:MAG TPA: WG repeat-containing protein, partial [Pyrinomonadaceae bacterium]
LGEELDSRSDIYSLGIVLYEMLSGKVPFNSPVSTAVVIQHVNQTPPSLCAQNPGLSAAVELVVQRALAKRREDRQQTANQLAEEFDTALTNPHITPAREFNQRPLDTGARESQRSPTMVMQAAQAAPARVSRPFYFRPWFLGAAGLVLLLPILYVGFFLWKTSGTIPKTLYPFQQDEKWGYIDFNGKVVVSPQYLSADSFHEGLAAVTTGTYPNQKTGYIDESGKLVISPQFKYAGRFAEGLAKASQNEKFGFIDRKGNWVFRPTYDSADDFSGDVASVTQRNQCGFVNKQGQVIVPLRFETCGSFKSDLAPVKINGKYGFINRTGQMVITPQFDFAYSFSEGMALVSTGSQRYGFIDTSGNYVISPQFSFAGEFSEGLAVAHIGESPNTKAGYIDKTGRFVIEARYNSAEKFAEGFAAVGMQNSYGYIDKTGAVVIKLEYDRANQFENGVAQVELDDKALYLDQSGRIIWRQPPRAGLGDISPEEKTALVEQMVRDGDITADCVTQDGGPRKVASVWPVDLNGDGVAEYEVIGKGCGCGGMRRCQMMYYRKTSTGYQVLLNAGPSEASVKNESTNSYRDIAVIVPAGNDMYGTVFKYNGTKYIAAECSEDTYVGTDGNGNPIFRGRRVPCSP